MVEFRRDVLVLACPVEHPPEKSRKHFRAGQQAVEIIENFHVLLHGFTFSILNA